MGGWSAALAAGACAPAMASLVSGHPPAPARTQAFWLDPPTDLSCTNSTRNHPADVEHQPPDLAVVSLSLISRVPVGISRRPVPGRGWEIVVGSGERVEPTPRLLPPQSRPAPTWQRSGAGGGLNAGMVSIPPPASWSLRRPRTTVAAGGRAHAGVRS